MTTRRNLLLALGAALLASPFAGRAQQKAKVPHIGYMSTGSLKTNEVFLAAFKDGLRELGYVDGKNIAIDARWAGNMANDFPEIADSLVKNQPSAIVTTCIPSTRAAKQATRTIPIVMSVDGDPITAGLISSYARPGANVTGTSTLFEALIPKWLELLTIAVPKVRHVAVLTNPDDLVDAYYWAQFQEAAKRLDVKVVQVTARLPAEIDPAFAQMKTNGSGALVVMTEVFLAGQRVELLRPVEVLRPMLRDSAGQLPRQLLGVRDHVIPAPDQIADHGLDVLAALVTVLDDPARLRLCGLDRLASLGLGLGTS